MPTMITMPLSTSPALARPRFSLRVTAMPIAAMIAPMVANGIRNQLPQPSNGTSAITIHSIATTPQIRLISPIAYLPSVVLRGIHGGPRTPIAHGSKVMHPVDLDPQLAPADRRVQQQPRHRRVEPLGQQRADVAELGGVADIDLQPRAGAGP